MKKKCYLEKRNQHCEIVKCAFLDVGYHVGAQRSKEQKFGQGQKKQRSEKRYDRAVRPEKVPAYKEEILFDVR